MPEGREDDVDKGLVLSEAQLQGSEETPSPFLPGTKIQFAWDSTSLGYFKTCPRLYYYHMIERWKPRGEAIHLRFGLEYHQALHDYELNIVNGCGHEAAMTNTTRQLLIRCADWDPDPTTKSEELKTKDNLLRTVIWYLDKFEDDPAETVVAKDGRPAIELSFKFELDWGPRTGIWGEKQGQPYLLCGHLDRVVRYHDELFVMDRKTTTSTPSSYYFAQFEPNNQMTLYTLASQVVINSPVKGVIIDAAQVAAGFSRFTRSFTYRTKEQLTEWLNDLRPLLAQAEVYAIHNSWPMNDTACNNYGGCRFREICSKSPQVREQFLQSKFEKGEQWNPLVAR